MDTAREIKRKGAKEIIVIYRRGRKQMPAEDSEVESAMNEGIKFLFQNNITKILGKDKVEKVECIKTELVKVEGDREKPINIDGSNYELETDIVVMALGSKPDIKILSNLGLELNEWGYIKTDENKMTSKENVYAAGDLIGTKSTVAWAAKSGRDAAEKICEVF